MVLDDDKFALVQICRELNKVVPGANIYATSSTSEAIRWTQIVDLEFIFLDFQLPDGKNGLELARLLSRLNPRAKLIIFSGIPRFEFQEQCQKTELALPFLEKPISKEDLAKLIGGGGNEYGN
jgi:two-component SAPR family response regulator